MCFVKYINIAAPYTCVGMMYNEPRNRCVCEYLYIVCFYVRLLVKICAHWYLPELMCTCVRTCLSVYLFVG